MQDEVTPTSVSGTADYIREVREQKGLTLQQVAEATRIPHYYLEILEGGGDDRLVSDRLYMVHFLRSYAAFLEVEGDTLAAQFVRENRGPAHVQIVPIQAHRSWKAIATATLTVLLMIGGGAYVYDPTLVGTVVGPVERILTTSTPSPTPPEAPGQRPSAIPATPPGADDTGSSVLQPEANETDPSNPRLAATAPEAVSAPEPGPGPVTAVTDRPLSPTAPDVAVSTAVQAVSAPSAAQDTPTPQAGETAAETSDSGEPPQQTPDRGRDATDDPNPSGPPVLAAVSDPPETDAADAQAQHSLTITADQEAWLRVWVDGGRPRDMLLAVGTSRTLSAQTGFVITFGNAGGVRLTLNGDELPPAGKSGQVVRGFKLPRDQ